MSKNVFAVTETDSTHIVSKPILTLSVGKKKAIKQKIPAGLYKVYIHKMWGEETLCTILFSADFDEHKMAEVAFHRALYNPEDLYDESVGMKKAFGGAVNNLKVMFAALSAIQGFSYPLSSEMAHATQKFLWENYVKYIINK